MTEPVKSTPKLYLKCFKQPETIENSSGREANLATFYVKQSRRWHNKERRLLYIFFVCLFFAELSIML